MFWVLFAWHHVCIWLVNIFTFYIEQLKDNDIIAHEPRAQVSHMSKCSDGRTVPNYTITTGTDLESQSDILQQLYRFRSINSQKRSLVRKKKTTCI